MGERRGDFWRRRAIVITMNVYAYFLVAMTNTKRAKKYETSKAIKLNETCFSSTNFIGSSFFFCFSRKCVTKLEKLCEDFTVLVPF